MTAARPLLVQTTDYHTGGEPFRIISGGVPPIGGTTVLERRRWIHEHLDHVRQLLVNEPRGHADMYGGFVVPPDDEGADLGVVFFHNAGYSTACGHGTIALATWAVETGVVPITGDRTSLVIDVPSGRLRTEVRSVGGQVVDVTFTNVPSYVAGPQTVLLDGREVAVDVAFGGAFYAIVAAADVGLSLEVADLGRAIERCRHIKDTLNATSTHVHPDHPDLAEIYGVILVEDLPTGEDGVLHQRNITVFADGEVDRSPTGSGTSARLALLVEQGRLGIGDRLHNRSVVDSLMTGEVVGPARVGPHDGIVTTVTGSAHLTGWHTFVLRPDDPIGTGFLLR